MGECEAGRTDYVVAATPRTGSSLLCAGLWDSGIAGRPGEVFAPDFREPWRRRWGLSPDAVFSAYMSRACGDGRTANGVFGTKIQWMHVAPLAREAGVAGPPGRVLDVLFPGARFVNTVREDRRAQALSWYRAITTGQWYRTAQQTALPAPSAPPIEEVLRLEEHIAWQQEAWMDHIETRGAAMLQISYEELSADYRGQVARVLAWLGLDPAAAARLPAPRLVRQSDDVTDLWRRELTAHRTVR